jgi:hypothetical protein
LFKHANCPDTADSATYIIKNQHLAYQSMINHTDLGNKPFTRFRVLQTLIAKGEVKLGGYRKNKIYGTLTCKAGKRMKPENRVFFKNEQEAITAGYRPCGNCMPAQYKQWKNNNGTI